MKDLFGNQTIRTLGLYQPFATLMGCGKEIETRWVQAGRMAPFPEGYYLLYSTQKAYTQNQFDSIALKYRYKGWNAANSDESIDLNGYALWVGKLVKRALLEPNEREKAFVDVDLLCGGMFTMFKPKWYKEQGRYYDQEYRLWGLHFRDVKRIKPFVFKGKQGVGILSEEDKNKIEFV